MELEFAPYQVERCTLGVLKRLHYPLELMLVCVRWYAAYPLSLRHLEEMMAERAPALIIRRCIAGR